MILPNGHDDLVHRTDGPQLPYTLTNGVTATREGLVFEDTKLAMFIVDEHDDNDLEYGILGAQGRLYRIPWPDAAKRLRYREGENYCDVLDDGVGIHCYLPDGPSDYTKLHRLAAILCDDAEAFRVLHWCVYNLEATE